MENNNYLAHHGVKGQRWGERKYQYENGSLTPEGRRHYGYGDGDVRSRIKMIRETARAERKMARVESAERRKDERQRQRLNAKLEKVKNADRIKAKKERDKQLSRDIKSEQHAINRLKMTNPAAYRQMKPYLTKDGRLSDVGKAKFNLDGTKKDPRSLNTNDLKKQSEMYEAQAEMRFNRAKERSTHLGNKVAKTVAAAGIAFAATYGAQSLVNKATGGALFQDREKSIKTAMATMLPITLAQLGLKAGGVNEGSSGDRYVDAIKQRNQAQKNAFELEKDRLRDARRSVENEKLRREGILQKGQHFDDRLKKSYDDTTSTKTKTKAQEQLDQFNAEFYKRNRVHKKSTSTSSVSSAPTAKTTSSKTYNLPSMSSVTSRTYNLPSMSSANYRQRERTINRILSDNRSLSINQILQSPSGRVASRVVNDYANVPVSEIAGYLPSGSVGGYLPASSTLHHGEIVFKRAMHNIAYNI